MVSLNLFRRRYYDLRYSYGLIGPLLAMGNFVLIAYNFTSLKVISFEIFTALFIVAIVCAMSLLGLMLRKYQMPTDFKLQYQRNTEMVKSQLAILKGIESIHEHLGHNFNEKYFETCKDVKKRREELEGMMEFQNYNVDK